jgi:hypothetical protein
VLLLRPHVEIGATTTGSGECKDDFQLSMVDMIKDQQPAMILHMLDSGQPSLYVVPQLVPVGFFLGLCNKGLKDSQNL